MRNQESDLQKIYTLFSELLCSRALQPKQRLCCGYSHLQPQQGSGQNLTYTPLKVVKAVIIQPPWILSFTTTLRIKGNIQLFPAEYHKRQAVMSRKPVTADEEISACTGEDTPLLTHKHTHVWFDALFYSFTLLEYTDNDYKCVKKKKVKAKLLVIEVIVSCIVFSNLQCCMSNMQLAYFHMSFWV